MSRGEDGGGKGGGKGSDKREPPKIPTKDPLRAPPPKRFYARATVEPAATGFRIALDGRALRTPGKRELAVPARGLADAIAAEWAAQGERIDPATMPLTRIVNSALDAVAQQWDAVADDIRAFAGHDLLCYRAEAPAALVHRQAEAWDPLLDWARRSLGAPLRTRHGVMPLEQTEAALAAVREALSGLGALELTAVHVLTTLTGSAVLALGLLRGHVDPGQAWHAATIDEAWQSEQWGADAEAEERQRLRRAEFDAAAGMLRLLRSRG